MQVFLLSTIAQPADQGGPGSLPYKQWGWVLLGLHPFRAPDMSEARNSEDVGQTPLLPALMAHCRLALLTRRPLLQHSHESAHVPSSVFSQMRLCVSTSAASKPASDQLLFLQGVHGLLRRRILPLQPSQHRAAEPHCHVRPFPWDKTESRSEIECICRCHQPAVCHEPAGSSRSA